MAKTVKFIFEGETNISIDGEIVKVNELALNIAERAVEILVPKGCKYIRETVAAEPASV